MTSTNQKSAEVIKKSDYLCTFFRLNTCMIQLDLGMYAPAVERSSNHYGK